MASSNVRLQIYYGKLADRSRPPAPLRRFIAQDDWDSLVCSVEQALVLDMQFQYAGMILITGFLLCCLLLVAITYGGLGSRQSLEDELPLSPLPVIFFMFLLGSMALAQQCLVRPRVVADINDVLAAFSAKYPGISFHLMGSGNNKHPFFIQVYTDGNQYDGVEVGTESIRNINIGDAINNKEYHRFGSQYSTYSQNNSVIISERLQELGKVKDLLSETEYNEKRKSIIEIL